MITDLLTKPYCSLFDRILDEDSTFRVGFDRQRYLGTLDAVLTETEEALRSGERNSHALQLALHPPRIIRAFVDYKIQNPSTEIELLLRDAIQLGIDIYRGDNDALEELRALRGRTGKSNDRGILWRVLGQPSDPVTWSATHPSRSRKTAEDLALRTNGSDVLFVALAHGGVAAGIDTYLRYCDMVGRDNSGFYVVRFSAHKLRDSTPKLTPAEIAYLQEQVNGRVPVVFDEDRATGMTLEEAKQFFASTVFPSRNVVALTNLDARAELISLGYEKDLSKLYQCGLEEEKIHQYITEIYTKKITNSEKSFIGKKAPYFSKFLAEAKGEGK